MKIRTLIRRVLATSMIVCLCAGSAEAATITSNAAETTPDALASQAEEQGVENSFRYSNSEVKEQDQNSGVSLFSAIPDWSKYNGKFYNSSGSVINGATMKGVDVSYHNGTINWDKVKASDVDYAIIRCGYGQDFKSQDDKKWAENVRACVNKGIPFGVYLYSYATNTTKAASEAQHALRLLREQGLAGTSLKFPVYYDMEDSSTLGLSTVSAK